MRHGEARALARVVLLLLRQAGAWVKCASFAGRTREAGTKIEGGRGAAAALVGKQLASSRLGKLG